MLEGVVLQQTRADDLYPWQGIGRQHHHHHHHHHHREEEDALVHQKQNPDGHPKRKKRGASKDTAKRIYTDAPLKGENNIKDEEPRKVGGRLEIGND